jgi:hypothetical protein
LNLLLGFAGVVGKNNWFTAYKTALSALLTEKTRDVEVFNKDQVRVITEQCVRLRTKQ